MHCKMPNREPDSTALNAAYLAKQALGKEPYSEAQFKSVTSMFKDMLDGMERLRQHPDFSLAQVK